MPGPIYFFTVAQQRMMSAVEQWAIRQLANAAAKAVVERIVDDPADPMNLAAYGSARPHDPGKMAQPGAPWVGKRKGKRK